MTELRMNTLVFTADILKIVEIESEDGVIVLRRGGRHLAC